MIYEKALAEHKRLEEQIKELEKKLRDCPEGKLLCAKNGKHYKWYQSDGHEKIYIPKRKRYLAEQLAVKKYLLNQIRDLKGEKIAIEFYLRHHKESTGNVEKMLTDKPEYKELLASYFKPISEELEEWVNESFDKNLRYPEQLTQRASNGKYVRSKSEVLIDMVLYLNRIPFRYECALDLGGTIIYPDFTIRHPKTGKTYYWEHFGKMDNVEYGKSVCFKLQQYISMGIIPSENLITTYETRNHQLSLEEIERIVKEYFL